MSKKSKIVKLNPLKTGNFRQKKRFAEYLATFFKRKGSDFLLVVSLKDKKNMKRYRIFYLK